MAAADARGVRPRVRALALVVPALAACSSGCGYRLLRAGGSEAAPPTVAVVTLENDSLEAGVELLVTRALRQQFLRGGAARLVSDPAAADWVVRGRVLHLETHSTSFSTVALAVEYSVRMTLSVDVTDREGGAIPLDRSALTDAELYLASADAEAARKNRHEALQRISDVLAGRIRDAVGLHLMVGDPGGAS